MWQTAIVAVAWVVALVCTIGQWVLQARSIEGGALAGVLEPSDVAGPLVTITMATVGAVIVLRGAAHRYGWIMLAAGSMSGVIGLAAHYSVHGQDVDLPFVTAAIWVQDLWLIAPFAVFLLTALFPDGTVASVRWRRPVKVVTIAWVVFIAVFAFIDREATNFFVDLGDRLSELPRNATGFLPVPESVFGPVWILLMLASIAIGLGSLGSRWRSANSELRLRVKWVLYAFGVLLGVSALSVMNQAMESGIEIDLGLRLPINLLASAAQVGLVVTLGFGVLKFRLYDVDLVINRTIVYGLLTMAVIATYVGVVLGVGALLPIEENVLALVVTAAVAVAFTPLRDMVQGWVNRLMFGQRDDPYAVLAKLGRLLARSGSPEATLQNLVETVAVSLKLPGAAIELEERGEWREWARWGELEDADAEVIRLEHRGEVVGRLLVTQRSRRESLSTKDIALLEDIAHQAGALARSVRLTMALRRSRERLVLAQEEERRRIRHDLHDELGPSLASQTFQLDAILERIEDDPGRAKPLLMALKEQNKQLVADIRRLVYELRPPALDELGVAGALSIQTSQLERSEEMAIGLEIRPDPLPDLPAAVEVAAYRIAREAIINTVRHARARECIATLEATDTELIVTVRDDGVGMDPSARPGVGLTSMRERTEELGGAFQVVSGDGRGTRVRAQLPLMNGSSSSLGGRT